MPSHFYRGPETRFPGFYNMDPLPPDPERANFEQLLERARTGCRESLGELLELCRQYLRRAAHPRVDSRLKPKHAPSDLMQDTLLEAVRDFPQFRGKSRQDFLAWILRILHNNQRNFERDFARSKRQITAELRLDDSRVVGDLKQRLRARTRTPSSEIGQREEDSRVRRAVNQMPEQHRAIIRMRTLEHQSFEAIALQLRCSAEAVRQIWHRSMRHLAEVLKGRNE